MGLLFIEGGDLGEWRTSSSFQGPNRPPRGGGCTWAVPCTALEAVGVDNQWKTRRTGCGPDFGRWTGEENLKTGRTMGQPGSSGQPTLRRPTNGCHVAGRDSPRTPAPVHGRMRALTRAGEEATTSGVPRGPPRRPAPTRGRGARALGGHPLPATWRPPAVYCTDAVRRWDADIMMTSASLNNLFL
jgi:hypothetical protein